MCINESSLKTLKSLSTDFDGLESNVPVFSTFSHFRSLGGVCFPIVVGDYVWVGSFDGKYIHILCAEKSERLRPIQFPSCESATKCFASFLPLQPEKRINGELLNLNIFKDSNPNQYRVGGSTTH